MAILTRDTIQSLAVLRALSQWQSGAFGPVRVHKTLFFADKGGDPDWTIFTFKRWFLGQYSDTISLTLNRLQSAGRVDVNYDGPSERIIARLSHSERGLISRFFRGYFKEWDKAFFKAFKYWAYLKNDTIIKMAHDDPSYKQSQHGEKILTSKLPRLIEFGGLSEDLAEELSDMVNGRLQSEISRRLEQVASKNITKEDWKKIYFNGD